MEERVRLGISSCLLGNAVRWNSGHKMDRYLTRTLGQFVDYVPVCPEVEAGFGVPRESMRLVGDPQKPRLITFKTKTDQTDQMLRWARKRVKELEKEDLHGFIFKSDSPSSGMIRVKVYTEKGMPVKKGVGMFAREFPQKTMGGCMTPTSEKILSSASLPCDAGGRRLIMAGIWATWLIFIPATSF
jgi:uncharacterized protein YbbK (DUF523 family)